MKKSILMLLLMSLTMLGVACTPVDEGDDDVNGNGEEMMEEDDDHEDADGETPEASTTNIMTAFETKYPDRDFNGFRLTLDQAEDGYAMGGLTGPEGAGSWWYAKAEDGEWVIIADGNGEPACDDLEGFPQAWVEASACN